METAVNNPEKHAAITALLSSIFSTAETGKFPPVGMTAPLLLREFDEFWEFNGREDSIVYLFPSQVIYVFLHVMLERHFPRCSIDPILRVLYRQELKDEPANFHIPLKHQAFSNWQEGKEEKVKQQATDADDVGSSTSNSKGPTSVKQEPTEESGQEPSRKAKKLDASLYLSKVFARALDSDSPPLGMTEMLLMREFYDFWDSHPQPDPEQGDVHLSHILLVFLHDMQVRHFPDCGIEPLRTALFEQELQDGVPGTSDTPLNNQAFINSLKKKKEQDAARDAERAVRKRSDIKLAGEVKSDAQAGEQATSGATSAGKGKQPARQGDGQATNTTSAEGAPDLKGKRVARLEFETVPRSTRGAGRGGPATSARMSGMGWRPGRLAAILARPRRAPSSHMALRSSLAQQLPFRNPNMGSDDAESEPARASKRAKN